MNSDPANQLFKRACAGDGAAFWQLVLPHRGVVYAVAYGLVKDHEQAEDLLHDVLVHAAGGDGIVLGQSLAGLGGAEVLGAGAQEFLCQRHGRLVNAPIGGVVSALVDKAMVSVLPVVVQDFFALR